MTDVHTTAEVARRLGVSQQLIQAKALKHDVGQLLHPRQRVYTDADIERLRGLIGRPPGRPPRKG